MRLRYKIPHKVTLRMVGPQFVAICTCTQWAKNANPRKYEGLVAAWYDDPILPSPIEELIAAAHSHATDHVMDSNGFQRKTREKAGLKAVG